MSEFNGHLSARGATRRTSGTPYTSRNSYAPGPLHIDIDEPPRPSRFAPLIALLVLVFFLLLQLLPATHYRHPFDPHRQWNDIIPSHPTAKQTVTNSSMQAEPPEHVYIFSWSDDLDLRPLAVLVNSTISSSRKPGNIIFYLLIPDDLEDRFQHNFMVLFPKSTIFIYRHNVIREKVKIIASDGENSILDFPHLLPFYIPKIFQNIRRFIYLVPDIIVKDKVEDLLQVNLTNSPVAAVEDCSQNFEVLNAIKKSSAMLSGTQMPYTENTCILDPSVLLVNAGLLAKENFIEVIKMWRKLLHREGARDGRSDQEIMLALNGNYTKLDASWNIRESRFSGIGSDVKIFHFDGEKKPWLKQAEGSRHTDMIKIWWDYLSPLADQQLRQPIV